MPPTAVLSEQQVEAVALIEQTYHLHGSIPTNDIITSRLGVSSITVKKWWEQPKFREALVKRGIDLRPESSKDLLTPPQLLLANMLLNSYDRRSVREKLEEAQVSSVQYNAWLKQPAFRDYLAKRAEDIFAGSDHDAYLALLDTVKGGDVKAIQLFFEMRGKYTPKQQLDINIESILVRIVEIVAKHVQEPEVIASIADDIELLAAGRISIGVPVPPTHGPSDDTPPPPLRLVDKPKGPPPLEF